MRIVECVEGITFTRFGDRDVVRHQLVRKIVQAYESHTGKFKDRGLVEAGVPRA